MIHIIHTPPAILARRRMWQMARCAAGAALAGLCMAGLARQARIIETVTGECNFQGVPFYPAETETSSSTAHLSTPCFQIDSIPLPSLPAVVPECRNSPEEVHLLVEEPSLNEQLETDANALADSAPHRLPQPEMHATKVTEAVYTPPSYRNCPKPPYPPRLRQRRLEGSMEVCIMVTSTGSPAQVEIIRSSGNHALDQHTCNWIMRHWTFHPAQNGGTAVESQVKTSIIFSLHS